MTKILTLALAAAFACGPTFAADTKADAKMAAETKANPQQSKMTTCQAQATEKKLESTARQEYVNNCLKAKPVAEKPKSKMAMCNEKTKGMTKAEADKARSECLKG
jgi:Ni/Co efflux regulator RcnB